MTHATVKSWSEEEGWGVLVSDDVPGEIFAHFSAISGPGYRSLSPGEQVTIELEHPGQDGCEYKATKVERTWRFGAEKDVTWINDGVVRGMSITASVPPVFAAYMTLAFPLGLEVSREDIRAAEDRFDDALLRVLCAHTTPQPWWLGFLETGASDVVFPNAPRVHVYGSWRYVLVEAGPREARTWRSEQGRWFTALPELMSPADRSWLMSSLWDDAWAGIGGPGKLISALLIDPELSPAAERTDPSVPDMWPSSLPEIMHERLKR